MSTKKETATVYDDKREVRTGLSEQNHAVDRALDETRDSITKTIGEVKKDIPRNTQAINDYQEQSKEIVDSYLESQKEIIQSFQSTWIPYFENTYGTFWNNWVSPRRAAEIYARTVSNCADNIMATNRLANNTIFANINAYKTFVQREKDNVKEFSRIAANTARTFENTSRDFGKQVNVY